MNVYIDGHSAIGFGRLNRTNINPNYFGIGIGQIEIISDDACLTGTVCIFYSDAAIQDRLFFSRGGSPYDYACAIVF